MNSDETGRKVALAGALLAGFAYFGVSILRDIFSTNKKNKDNIKSGRKRRISENQTSRGTPKEEVDGRHCLSHASSQTDLTLPIGVRQRNSAFRNVPPELWTPWAKTIEERIRELNIRLVNTTNFHFRNYGRHSKAKCSYSLGNTPRRYSPALLSPDPHYGMHSAPPVPDDRRYRSVEHLDQSPRSKSPIVTIEENGPQSSLSALGIKRTIDLSIPSETEIAIHKRTLDRLFGKSNPNLSQQDSQSLTILLMSRDEDLMIKTLSVIANCCAFSVNIDTICNSGCLLMMYELLSHKLVTVQIAATNAVANVANGERAQELLRECIPILIDKVKNSDNDVLVNMSLRALANLALKDSNQLMMASVIGKLMALLSHPNPSLRLQSMKLLVNMSSNSSMVPYLLAAKAPINLYSLLDPNHDVELVLRLTNFLANVIDITCLREIKARDLPIEFKAPQPETLYAAIYGYEATELLLKRLNTLLSVPHEDVVFQVKRILKKVR